MDSITEGRSCFLLNWNDAFWLGGRVNVRRNKESSFLMLRNLSVESVLIWTKAQQECEKVQQFSCFSWSLRLQFLALTCRCRLMKLCRCYSGRHRNFGMEAALSLSSDTVNPVFNWTGLNGSCLHSLDTMHTSTSNLRQISCLSLCNLLMSRPVSGHTCHEIHVHTCRYFYHRLR